MHWGRKLRLCGKGVVSGDAREDSPPVPRECEGAGADAGQMECCGSAAHMAQER